MQDKGTVVSAENGKAKVEVECLSACQDCSAHSICIGHNKSKGIISVNNSLHADPGDSVIIMVPENRYSRSLTIMFGGGLIFVLIGLMMGYLGAGLFSISKETGSIAGLVVGLAVGASVLRIYFNRENARSLYPEIKEIVHKGACHG